MPLDGVDGEAEVVSLVEDRAEGLLDGLESLGVDDGDFVGIEAGGEQPSAPPNRSGLAVLTLEGKVVAKFGRWGNYDGQFMMAHDIALSPNGDIYVNDGHGQGTNDRIVKFDKNGNGEIDGDERGDADGLGERVH